MQKLKQQIAEAISASAARKFAGAALTPADIAANLEYPPDPAMGELALPCFRLSKVLRRSPKEIAETLAADFS